MAVWLPCPTPTATKWNVHRRWWPFPDLSDLFDLDWFVLSIVVSLPFVVLWPFWLAAKLVGVKWRIVIERNHTEVGSELVRGYARSGRRIDALAAELARGARSGYFQL